ncbi:MAG: hypothetical protein WAL61_04210 [Acidimicrobiales bacterium]
MGPEVDADADAVPGPGDEDEDEDEPAAAEPEPAPGWRSITAVVPPVPPPPLGLLPEPGRIGPLRLLRAFGGAAATLRPA